jgi:hypothetical protein
MPINVVIVYLLMNMYVLSDVQVLDGDVIELPSSNNYEVSWQIPEDNGQPIDFFLLSYYPVVVLVLTHST